MKKEVENLLERFAKCAGNYKWANINRQIRCVSGICPLQAVLMTEQPDLTGIPGTTGNLARALSVDFNDALAITNAADGYVILHKEIRQRLLDICGLNS